MALISKEIFYIACDSAGCGNNTEGDVQSTPTNARARAIAAGWSIAGLSPNDFCPKHSNAVETNVDYQIVDGNEGLARIGDVLLRERSHCEHCDYLEPFTPTFYFDGAWVCYDCFTLDNKHIPPEFIVTLGLKVEARRIRFYTKKLKESQAPRWSRTPTR